MAKDPAFLFYSNDFLAGTFTMTDEQVGKYIRLLCLQHQKYELSENDMKNICKTYDKDIYCKFEHKDGKYFNIRLREEAIRRKNYSESRKNNRLGKEVSKSYVKHMETETTTEIIDDTENTKDPTNLTMHLPKESPFANLDTFLKEADEDPELKRMNADLEYYHAYWISACTASNKRAYNWFQEIKRYIFSQERKDNFRTKKENVIQLQGR